MRNAIKMLPNEQLRRERQRRGWSREYVAKRIGVADPKTIGRWERGVAFPSSFFLQKLCNLFGMLAQDLGLFLADHDSTLQAVARQLAIQQNDTFLVSASQIFDPAIPPPLVEIDGLVGRDELVQQLKQGLCAGKRLTVSALSGLPGVGKTALARELVYDNDIQQHFGDGILWVGLGPQPNVPDRLRRWGSLLGIPAADMALLKGEEDWAGAIRATIGMRRMLLVIDDAWRSDEALVFKAGGPNCAYLLTKCDAARALVQSVGGLPLALTLMGKYLQSQAYSGQPRRLRAALERLHHAEECLQLTMQQAPLERLTVSSVHAPLSLQAVIETSARQLDVAAQQALSLLSVFPAKPHSFSEAAALAVSSAPVELLDELIDAGLLESAGPERYTLHQTIADYAGTRQYNSAAYERMVEYFIRYVETHETDFDALERETSNVLAALQVAFERGMSTLLIQGAIPFSLFLESRGLYELAETHLQRAGQAARSLGGLAIQIKVLYHQGRIADLHGDTAQAEALMQKALALASQSGYSHRVCAPLENGADQRIRDSVAAVSSSVG